jgi:hypothetical protein
MRADTDKGWETANTRPTTRANANNRGIILFIASILLQD